MAVFVLAQPKRGRGGGEGTGRKGGGRFKQTKPTRPTQPITPSVAREQTLLTLQWEYSRTEETHTGVPTLHLHGSRVTAVKSLTGQIEVKV